MAPIVAVALVKELFKFGGSFRKEAIGIGTFIPSVVSVFDTCQLTSCAAVTGTQWGFLLGSTIALVVHLNHKRLESAS